MSWQNQALYKKEAEELAKKFVDNFKKYLSDVGPEVPLAGPILK